MKTCPACSRENPEITRRCFGCDRLLPVDPPEPAAAPAERVAPAVPAVPSPPVTDPPSSASPGSTSTSTTSSTMASESGPAVRGWSRAARAAAGVAALVAALVAAAGLGVALAGGGGEGRQPTSATTTEPAPTQPLVSGTGPFFENCDQAQASGATPLRTGDPGYREALDQDGDGLACE